jgi:hypothetical protein
MVDSREELIAEWRNLCHRAQRSDVQVAVAELLKAEGRAGELYGNWADLRAAEEQYFGEIALEIAENHPVSSIIRAPKQELGGIMYAIRRAGVPGEFIVFEDDVFWEAERGILEFLANKGEFEEVEIRVEEDLYGEMLTVQPQQQTGRETDMGAYSILEQIDYDDLGEKGQGGGGIRYGD